jgi:hypothetical protein
LVLVLAGGRICSVSYDQDSVVELGGGAENVVVDLLNIKENIKFKVVFVWIKGKKDTPEVYNWKLSWLASMATDTGC